MSGHSKWAQIKHKKAVTDKKRGNLFSKLARAITIAAKTGSDREMNARLRLAISKARAANMPSENIERAIRKAAEAEAASEHEVLYEAYAPGGSALLIEGITDNKNRAAQEIRHILAEGNGKFAELGSVSWMFERKGIIILDNEANPVLRAPEGELLLIDAGAEDIAKEDGLTIITSSPELREQAVRAFEKGGIAVREHYDGYIPKSRVLVSPADAAKTASLIEKLEEHDDIQNVWSNLETSLS